MRKGSRPAKVDLQAALTAVLGVGHDVPHGRLVEIRCRLTRTGVSMWISLPVDAHVCVDKRSLRYGMLQYFMHPYSFSLQVEIHLGRRQSHVDLAAG